MKNNHYYFRRISGAFFVLLLTMSTLVTNAQMTLVIGDNDGNNGTTGYPCPLEDFYYATHAQYLYTAAELAAAGVTPGGHIDSIGWIIDASFTSGILLEGYSIALKNTSITDLDLNMWETGTTLVYGPINYSYTPGFAGNQMFPTTAFTYTGGNLIVDICGGITSGGFIENPLCQWTTGLPFIASHQWRQDVADGCGNPAVDDFANIENNRPRLVMTYTCPPGVITAAFNTSDDNPPVNTPVTFTDQSSNNTIGWHWDFGDGDTSILQNPSHTYTSAGTYIITLNALGCSSSDITYDTIVVQGDPIAMISPDSLSANLACGDSATFQITVTNNGVGDLVYGTTGSSNSQVRVLALTYGSDMFSEYPSTLAAINTYFTNYILTDTNATDPAVISNLLVGNNVLLLPEKETGSIATYNSWSYAINNFLLTGGTVIQCGANNSIDTVLFTSGLWTSTGYNVVDVGLGGSNMLTVDSVTRLTTGLSGSTFLAPTACYVNEFGDADKRTVVSYQGHDAVSYRKIGGGKVIFLAFDYYSSNNDSKRIIANAIEWGGESGLPTWITTDVNTDTVAPSGSTILNVTFHASGLPQGTYYGVLGISTNDPNNPYVPVTCTLTVAGGPIVSLSDSCVDFGTIMENTTDQQVFSLINSGCDTMFVTGITAALPEYNITGMPSFLLPGASAPITVTFSPTSVGVYNNSITILNSAGDTTFCLNGSAGPAPVINTVTTVSNQINSCTGTTTSDFDINNTGGSDLNYTITGLPSWAQVSSSSGSVVASGTETITVTFDANGLNDGTYNANINVNTNDPVTPVVTIALTLVVDGDPVVSMSVTCLNFAPIFETASAQQTFQIINTGCDTLDVTALISSLPEYSASAAPGLINPGSSTTITVTFNPAVAGIYNGTLQIQNSDVDTTICLTGEGLIAPHIFPNTTQTVAHDVPACNGVDSTTFWIYNTGGSNLYLTITGMPSWAVFSTTIDTIAAGDSLEVTVVMSSGTFSGGNQTTSFSVNSNDPVAPVVNHTLIMQVLTNPCFSATGSIDPCTGIGTFNSSVIVNPPTSWTWVFGDGDSGFVANPIHQFSEPAGTILNVMAIGCTAGGCDTEYVQVTMPQILGPTPAACLPQTANPSTGGALGIGPTFFQLGHISNTSTNAGSGYQNFTCSDTTTLNPGDFYTWVVSTGQTYEETVKCWVDWNNDGAFDVSELLFEDSAVVFTHAGLTVQIPFTAVMNTALRLRLESEYSGNAEPNGCSDLDYGQNEDYTVFVDTGYIVNEVANTTSSSVSMSVYPNPFDMTTTIEYNLNKSESVTVEVFNVVGEKVETFAASQLQGAGKHAYQFTGTSTGIYTVKLTVGESSTIQKLVKMQ